MKKYLFLAAFSLVSFFVSAQIKVNSSGDVGIKMTNGGGHALDINGKTYVYAPDTEDWSTAFKTVVSNENACAYHLYNNYYNQDVFFVNGRGYLWCKLGGYFGSDINMKEDIRELSSPLENLMKLHGVKYKYKDDKEKDKSKLEDRLGLIAQEVEKVIPEVVKEMNDGTKAITYTDLIAVIIEAIKEQQSQIEELKKLINKQ